MKKTGNIWGKKLIGEGGSNRIFKFPDTHRERYDEKRSYEGPWVCKIPGKKTPAGDNPERAVRVFQEIHPEYVAAEVKFGVFDNIPAWVLPYFKDAPKLTKRFFGDNEFDYSREDEETIALKVLEIYRQTRRIVVDAMVEGNFRYAEEKSEAKRSLVCVDVGMAVRRGSLKAEDYFDQMNVTPRCLMRSPTLIAKIVDTLILLETKVRGEIPKTCLTSFNLNFINGIYEILVHNQMINMDLLSGLAILFNFCSEQEFYMICRHHYPLRILLSRLALGFQDLFTKETFIAFTGPNCNKLQKAFSFFILASGKVDLLLTNNRFNLLMNEENFRDSINALQYFEPVAKQRQLVPIIEENKPLQQALSVAYQYIAHNKDRWFSKHGSHGEDQTKTFINNLLNAANENPRITETEIRKEMRSWLRGYGFWGRKSNANHSSRAGYAAIFFNKAALFQNRSTSLQARENALAEMLGDEKESNELQYNQPT